MLANAFNEFAILMALSVVIGFVAIKLRQPLILSFIVVGIVAGPSFLGWITSNNEIEVLASFGITLLLFIVGLKLDLHLIKTFGKVALLVGMSQILVTTALAFAIGLACGMTWSTALFVGFVMTFSSTVIIVKVLSDRFEIDSLYGRMSIGILIIQDLVVVLMIIFLSSLSWHVEGQSLWYDMSMLIVKATAFLLAVALMMRYVLPSMIEHFAKSRELLVLFAISWAVVLAVVSEELRFGKEVGGFIAGVSLASTRYREIIVSRLDTVRNLLLLFFFLNLGSILKFDALDKAIWPAVIFSLFVLLGKPLIVMVTMGVAGFRKRTGFLTGLTMGQISEFSLILAALGVELKYIDVATEGLITFVGLVTIGISTYLLAYANNIYQLLSPFLKLFERKVCCREDAMPDKATLVDVIIYGFGRHGEHMAGILKSLGLRVMGVDFNPSRVREWHDSDIHLRYGDAEDVDFTKSLPLRADQWVVSTVPHREANHALISSLRELGFAGKIAVSAYHESDFDYLKKYEVDLIFVPFKDAALSAAEQLAKLIKG